MRARKTQLKWFFIISSNFINRAMKIPDLEVEKKKKIENEFGDSRCAPPFLVWREGVARYMTTMMMNKAKQHTHCDPHMHFLKIKFFFRSFSAVCERKSPRIAFVCETVIHVMRELFYWIPRLQSSILPSAALNVLVVSPSPCHNFSLKCVRQEMHYGAHFCVFIVLILLSMHLHFIACNYDAFCSLHSLTHTPRCIDFLRREWHSSRREEWKVLTAQEI